MKLQHNVDKLLDGIKTVKFDINGDAINAQDIMYQVRQLIIDNFIAHRMQGAAFDSTLRRLDSYISGFLRDPGPYSNYYENDGNGAKITKRLQGVLLKTLEIPKAEVKEKFAIFCKDISSFYCPEMKVEASMLLPKEYFGEGIIESGPTCFNEDGENWHHKEFLSRFNRIRLLYVRDAYHASKRARCVVYFPGGRRMLLFNFYYNRFPNNWRILVDAAKKCLGLKNISYGRIASQNIHLPIYLNGDGVEVKTHNSHVSERKVLFPCPYCSGRVEVNKFFWDKCCCSRKCHDKNRKEREQAYCETCEEYFHPEHVMDFRGQAMCEDCMEQRTGHCYLCEEREYAEKMVGVHLTNRNRIVVLCEGCASEQAFTCEICGEAYYDREGYVPRTLENGKKCCHRCDP